MASRTPQSKGAASKPKTPEPYRLRNEKGTLIDVILGWWDAAPSGFGNKSKTSIVVCRVVDADPEHAWPAKLKREQGSVHVLPEVFKDSEDLQDGYRMCLGDFRRFKKAHEQRQDKKALRQVELHVNISKMFKNVDTRVRPCRRNDLLYVVSTNTFFVQVSVVAFACVLHMQKTALCRTTSAATDASSASAGSRLTSISSSSSRLTVTSSPQSSGDGGGAAASAAGSPPR